VWLPLLVVLASLWGADGARAQAAGGEEEKIIAVLTLRSENSGVPEAELLYFTEIVREAAQKYATRYKLMDRENINVILEGFGKDASCAEEGSCEVDIGKRLNAAVVASGSLYKVGDSYRVILTMHETGSARRLATIKRKAATRADIEDAIKEAMPEFFAPIYQPDTEVRVALPPPDPNAGHGHLFVDSSPSKAAIVLNGEGTGRQTPFLFEDLAVGHYRIELDTGEVVGGKVARVKPDQVVRVAVKLETVKRGSLLINTEPPGLTVRLDGEVVGLSPLFIPAITAGDHRVYASGRTNAGRFRTAGEQPAYVKAATRNRVTVTAYDAFLMRRERWSFVTRVAGGMDLLRTGQGPAGLAQLGFGTGERVDIFVGVGYPGYILVGDFEINLVDRGRWIPTLTLRGGAGFEEQHKFFSAEALLGLEFWVLDWLAVDLKAGAGYGWNRTPPETIQGLFVPGWLGTTIRL